MCRPMCKLLTHDRTWGVRFFRLCLTLILLTVCRRSVTWLQVDSCNILASEILPTLCRTSPQLFPNYLSVFLLHHSTTRKPPARKSPSPVLQITMISEREVTKRTHLQGDLFAPFMYMSSSYNFFYDIDRATWIYISYGQQKTFYVNKMHAISDVKLSKVQVLNSRRATILIDC